MVASHFNRDEAFTRNIGLLTIEEQERLRDFTIAIPGMGGVGGANLISLVRQGFEKFRIADLDVYELKNFNRQYGARIDTLDKEIQSLEVRMVGQFAKRSEVASMFTQLHQDIRDLRTAVDRLTAKLGGS